MTDQASPIECGFKSLETLLIADKVATLAEGAQLAVRAIDEGRTRATLEKLVAITTGKG